MLDGMDVVSDTRWSVGVVVAGTAPDDGVDFVKVDESVGDFAAEELDLRANGSKSYELPDPNVNFLQADGDEEELGPRWGSDIADSSIDVETVVGAVPD